MHTFRVFHVNKPFNGRVPEWPVDYHLVAEVQATSPQAAFARTQSHDRHWSLQPGVACHAPDARSTSIGDVVVGPDGKAHRCKPVGWLEL
jgi:hypothetical protein